MIIPPKIAPTATKKMEVPPVLASEIQKLYSFAKFKPDNRLPLVWCNERKAFTSGGISYGTGKEKIPPKVEYYSLPDVFFISAYQILTPIMEDWAQTRLIPSNGFGIRSYGNNSILHMHRDRIETHIISCIIHVDDKSNTPWHLDFIDHDNTHQKITFEVGEMLLYESLCIHGRMTPFDGEYYRNMYMHWAPFRWNIEPYIGMKMNYELSDFVSPAKRDIE